MIERLRAQASQLQPHLVELRRALHRIPEQGLQLPKTQEMVLASLDGLGLEVTTGKALTSVTAVLRGAAPGPSVLLRGDMDALPVEEQNDLPYISEHPGVMHACGHGLHTAMLVGAARLLSANRDALCGDVIFMFQPGEEGYDGAQLMIDEGVLEATGTAPTRAYGIHVKSSTYPAGTFATKPGAFMASADEMWVTVRGAGGHGSAPHRAKDPVPAAAEMILGLQTAVTRQFDVFDPTIVTTGFVQAGTRANIIPDRTHFQSTFRCFSADTRARVKAAAERVCTGVAAAHGVSVDTEYRPGYPMTINDVDAAAEVAATAREVFGGERFEVMAAPAGGAEDFSRILERVPGCYLYLGATPPDAGPSPADNHSGLAIFDDSVLADGSLMHAVLAAQALSPAGHR